MNEILQNTLNDKQEAVELSYTYSTLEQESEALENMFFRLFEKVSKEITKTPS